MKNKLLSLIVVALLVLGTSFQTKTEMETERNAMNNTIWVSITIAAFAAIIGILRLGYAIVSDSERRNRKMGKEFVETRAYIKNNRKILHEKAIETCLKHLKHLRLNKEIQLITGENWIPSRPVPLNELKLSFADDIEPSISIKKLSIAGYKNYSEAILNLDKPKKFNDNRQYRLLIVKPLELIYSKKPYSYFDKINNGGILDYKMARSLMKRSDRFAIVRNKLMKDLIKPSQYIVLSGIDTLTLLNKDGNLRLIMHYRGKEETAFAMGVYHVIPAGEFQPSCIAASSFYEDFSIWKNILRETAEELAGIEEYDGNSGVPFDYSQDPFFKIQNEYEKGNIKPFFLGLGLDPLTLQANILTCVVYKEDVFSSIFPKIMTENNEGRIITEKVRWGKSNIEKEFESYFTENTLTSCVAILRLVKKNLDFFKNCF